MLCQLVEVARACIFEKEERKHMKKWIAILLTLCLALSALACTKQPAAEPTTAPVEGNEPDATEPTEAPAEPTADGYEIALVTDVGNIDDQSFNQYT